MLHVVVYAAFVWAAVTAVLLLLLGIVILLERTGVLHPSAEDPRERERIAEAFTHSAQDMGWGSGARSTPASGRKRRGGALREAKRAAAVSRTRRA